MNMNTCFCTSVFCVPNAIVVLFMPNASAYTAVREKLKFFRKKHIKLYVYVQIDNLGLETDTKQLINSELRILPHTHHRFTPSGNIFN